MGKWATNAQNQPDLAQIPALPLTSFVTLDAWLGPLDFDLFVGKEKVIIFPFGFINEGAMGPYMLNTLVHGGVHRASRTLGRLRDLDSVLSFATDLE